MSAFLHTLAKLALTSLVLGALMSGCYVSVDVHRDGYTYWTDESPPALDVGAVVEMFTVVTLWFGLVWMAVLAILLLVVQGGLSAERSLED